MRVGAGPGARVGEGQMPTACPRRTLSETRSETVFFRGKRPAGGPETNRQAIVFRFLSGPKRMLGGEARNFASDRADFLGSHPESRIHPRRLKPT